jgi:hypothetical protein
VIVIDEQGRKIEAMNHILKPNDEETGNGLIFLFYLNLSHMQNAKLTFDILVPRTLHIIATFDTPLKWTLR